MFIEPTITWVPSGLLVHMAWHKNCVKKYLHTFAHRWIIVSVLSVQSSVLENIFAISPYQWYFYQWYFSIRVSAWSGELGTRLDQPHSWAVMLQTTTGLNIIGESRVHKIFQKKSSLQFLRYLCYIMNSLIDEELCKGDRWTIVSILFHCWLVHETLHHRFRHCEDIRECTTRWGRLLLAGEDCSSDIIGMANWQSSLLYFNKRFHMSRTTRDHQCAHFSQTAVPKLW